MNLQEAKQLLKNKGYKLIREDAYMDAMDQELDDIRQDNIKSSDSLTLKFLNFSPEKLEAAFNKFKFGEANAAACKALGRICDLMGRVTREQEEQIKNLTPGESITFTTIPEWFGRFPMNRNHFLEYSRHYGKDLMLKLIALACSKNNAATLGAI